MCEQKMPEMAFPKGGVPRRVAPQVRRVNNLIARKINCHARANGVDEVTQMHGWILRYLYQRRDQQVFQRDIERVFTITRSTVTNILQLMERKGYITRESVPQDARLKRIQLTPKGAVTHERVILSLQQTDAYIASLLTEQENDELLRILDKLAQGLQ